MQGLKGKTLFITGASRGIGKSIALRAARDGANIIIAARTDTPHRILEGTIHTAADHLGGIDILADAAYAIVNRVNRICP